MFRRQLLAAGLGLLLVACGGGAPAGPPGASGPSAVPTVSPDPLGAPAAGAAALAPPELAPATLEPEAPSGSGDWPMYGHDPSRSGTNAAETILTVANVTQLTARWQVDIGTGPGPPSGAPSVAGGRVYVASSVPGGPNLFTFDAVSGALDWKADIGHGSACFNVGIGATPAISGSVVVAGGGDDAYYGLDSSSGARLWRNALSAGPSGFPWASPAIADGRAYLGVSSGCDNPSVRGELRAVDLQTGAQVANQYFVPAGQAGAGIWNSPAVSPDGQTIVVTTGEDDGGYDGPYNRAFVALDPADLTPRGAAQQGSIGADLDFATTPVVFEDRARQTLVAANHKDEFFYVYDVNDLAAGPLWSRQTGTVIGLMPAYDPRLGDEGTLFFVDGYSQINAVDPLTGANRWAPAALGTPHGNLAIANGLIFVNNGENGVLILDEASGQHLTTLTPAHAGKAYSGLAVAHGFVYWLSGNFLNAWSLPATP